MSYSQQQRESRGDASILGIPSEIRRLPTKTLGPALKLAYALLWSLAGNRPSVVETTAVALAAELGASERAGRKWITELEKVGLLELEPSRTKGVLNIYVHAPGDTALRLAKEDPPRPLIDGLEPDLCAHKGPETPSDLCAHKGPTTVAFQPAEPETQQPISPNPTGKPPDLCARKGPALPMTHERKSSNSSLPHTSIPMRDTDLSARKGPQRLSDLAAKVEEQTSPQQRLDTWKKRIIRAVGDPEMNQIIAERAAYAVTQNEFDAEEMREILATVERKRKDKSAKNPGGLFMHLCRKAGLELARNQEGGA